MKLVDILARELKTWPDNNLVDLSACFVAQDSDGMLVTLDPEEKPNADQFYQGIWARSHWTGGDLLLEVAEDYASAIVTRAEWQAAVDALNADKCDHSHGNKIGCPECGELNAPKVVEWDGVGLPPVGTVCQYQNSLGSWFKVEITAIAKKGICFIQPDLDGENYACKVSSKLRPIRTAEQVAAEERKKAIEEMVFGVCGCEPDGGNTSAFMVCGFLYDAGYRKQ